MAQSLSLSQAGGIEIPFPEGEFIVSKTDTQGRITYGNSIFVRISGYSKEELIGAPHNILRHPDMPKTIFHLLWTTIKGGYEIFAYVKNRTKQGNYYWVKAHVTPDFNERGEIIGYHSARRPPKRNNIPTIEALYRELSSIERREGIPAAVAHLNRVIAEAGKKSYGEFIFNL
ncbi:MAG: PAS domain-containing protein [Campylobacterales bacterium]